MLLVRVPVVPDEVGTHGIRPEEEHKEVVAMTGAG
jgi:hypothetical protein